MAKPKKTARPAARTPRIAPRKQSWPFHEPRNLVTMSLRRIFFGDRPFLYVLHEEDGSWQMLDNQPVTDEEACLVALEEVVEKDATMLQVAALPLGWYAIREYVGGPWWTAPKGVSIRDHYNKARKAERKTNRRTKDKNK